MSLPATGAVGLALVLDATVAEFPGRVHPVALFGRLVAPVDREWRYPHAVGVLVAAVLPACAAAVAGLTTWLAAGVGAAIGPAVGFDIGDAVGAAVAAAIAGGWLFAATSLRLLLSTAAEVVDGSATDPGTAREAAPALVGRDPDDLSPGELRSAAVESAAENLADGLVAPLLSFVVGVHLAAIAAVGPTLPAAPPAGAPAGPPTVAAFPLAVGVAAATWVKAVNTLDSMLGYRSKPVGRASARLDDALMWLPARASAVMLAVGGRDSGALVRAREWRRAPASPNSGWPMATLAAVLDVRLAKPGAYVLNPDADLPSPAEAREGVRVVGVAGGLAFLIAGGLAIPTAGVIAWA